MTAPEQNSEFLSLLNLWAPVIVIALVVLSYALHKIKKTPHPMTLKETGANLSIFVIWKFFFFSAGAALHLLAFTWIKQWIPWTAPSGLSGFLLCLLAVDFLYYWKHRCEHRVSLLWPQHRVHHGRNEKYLDKNYGGILIIWDRLFGTYEAEGEEVDYGTVDLLESYNPVTINLKPWINLWRDVKVLPPSKSKFKALFRSPGDLH